MQVPLREVKEDETVINSLGNLQLRTGNLQLLENHIQSTINRWSEEDPDLRRRAGGLQEYLDDMINSGPHLDRIWDHLRYMETQEQVPSAEAYSSNSQFMGITRSSSEDLEPNEEDQAEAEDVAAKQDHSKFAVPLDPIYPSAPWQKEDSSGEELAPLLEETRIGSPRRPTSLDLKHGIDRILSPIGKEKSPKLQWRKLLLNPLLDQGVVQWVQEVEHEAVLAYTQEILSANLQLGRTRQLSWFNNTWSKKDLQRQSLQLTVIPSVNLVSLDNNHNKKVNTFFNSPSQTSA